MEGHVCADEAPWPSAPTATSRSLAPPSTCWPGCAARCGWPARAARVQQLDLLADAAAVLICRRQLADGSRTVMGQVQALLGVRAVEVDLPGRGPR